MNSSEQLGELFGALAKAQAEMDAATKDSENPFFKSNYADLAAVVGVSRPALCKNNLCVTQPPIRSEGNDMILLTVLGHASGQWISSEMLLRPPKTDAQSLGSYITYMRRYAYASIIGVVTKDDDGEAGMARISSSQASEIMRLLAGDKIRENKMLQYYKIRRIEELPESEYHNIIHTISKN